MKALFSTAIALGLAFNVTSFANPAAEQHPTDAAGHPAQAAPAPGKKVAKKAAHPTKEHKGHEKAAEHKDQHEGEAKAE